MCSGLMINEICEAPWFVYLPQSLNIKESKILLTECISVFYVDRRINSGYFRIEHYMIGFYNRDGVRLLHGTS